MSRWFRPSLRRREKKNRRPSAVWPTSRVGVFRAVGWQQLEGRMLLTAQLVVNTINDSGAGSLRDAITQANTDGGANISFNIPGDSAQNPQTIGLLSALPALGNGITISGPGANELTINGRNSFQVFYVSGGSTVSISGLSIENGVNKTATTHGSATTVAGGGVLNDGTLTLTDDVVSNNEVFDDGTHFADGAGIYNDGTLAINDCTIANNTAFAFGVNQVLGGGIGNDGTLTITASTINGNSAQNNNSTSSFGGGIATSGTLTVVDSTISGNTASSSGTGSAADGGGIDGANGAVVKLTNSTIAGNSLQGVSISAGPPTKGFGGGISGFSDTFTLTNCTVVGNTAVTAGGGIDAAGQGSVTLNLTNTIVAKNTVGTGGTNVDINGSVATADHDLIGDGTSSLVTNGTNGNQVGTTANPIDPKLGPLSSNGGATETMPLEQQSPAIDAGDNAVVANPPFPGPPFTDQRGTGFPRIVNGTVDIGAFEFSPIPSLVVTTTADDLDGGTLADPDGPDSTMSLREAITLANLEGGGIITFDIPGMSAQSPQTITLTSALPALNAAITIAGPGAGELTVSGNDQVQVFNVTSGSVVSISGLTIAHGFNNTPALNGGVLPFVAGGGIFNAGTLTLVSDVLTHNAATDSANNGAADGGAIYNIGTLTVNACALTSNTASETGGGNTPSAAGGAIADVGQFGRLALMTITDSTISGNSVSAPLFDALGGGLLLNGTATIAATTISGNTATGASAAGGGIYDTSSTSSGSSIVDSTVSGNTANATGAGDLGEGGGIDDFANASLALTNCTIANNTVTSADRGVGGGIVAFEDVQTPLTLTNCTVTGNADNFGSVGSSPTSGGGGIYDQAVIGLVNTIVAGNTESTGGIGADVSNTQGFGQFSADDHNLIGVGDGSGLTNGSHGDQVGSAASPLDAKLGPLANNGGPTQTVALLAGSPALDTGDNAAVKNPPFPPPFTDQRGTGYPRIINGTVDIGAFEAGMVWTGAVDANWSTPGNWSQNRAPVNGDSLDFPSTAQHLTNTDDLPAVTSLNAITFSGNTLPDLTGYHIEKGAGVGSLTIGTGGLVDDSTAANGLSTENTIDLDLTLSTDLTANVQSVLTELLLNGLISGSGGVIKQGAGTLGLGGSVAETYQGPTTVNAGDLEVDGETAAASTVTINNGASLSGQGLLANSTAKTIDGPVSVAAGGQIAPGYNIGNVIVGTLNTKSDVTFAGGSTFAVETADNSGTDTASELTSTGTVSLNGATLALTSAGGLTVGHQLIVLQAGTLSGTFGNAPTEGSTLTAGGQTYKVSYLNNKVTLTVEQPSNTLTWTGGSTTSSNWSDPANWDLNRKPQNGDNLVFPDENVARTTNTNDISGLSLNSITFGDELNGPTATPYVISGQALTVGAGGILDGVSASSAALHTDQLNLNITLSANQTWSMTTTAPSINTAAFETLVLGGTVALRSFSLDLAANTGETNDVFQFGGAINGAGKLTVDTAAGAIVWLTQADGYTGGTLVTSGTLLVTADGALGPGGTSDGGTTVGNGSNTIGNEAGLVVDTTYNTPEAVTVDNGVIAGGFNPITATVAPASFAGPISFSSSNGQLDLALAGEPFTLAGNVTFGNFDLHAVNENPTAGATLIVDGTMTGGGTLQVVSGANFGGTNNSGPLTLAGTGTVKAPINISGGSTLRPGGANAATDTGTLSNTGNVTFQANSKFAVQLNGTSAGQFDQLSSTGTVDLGNAALNLSATGSFPAGSTFVIVKAGAPITTTFLNLPEGSTTFAGSQNFTVSYLNDQVTLTVPAPVTPATITWTGKSTANSNWSDAANWDLNRAPINGDDLVFPATAQRLSNNDDIAGLSVHSVTFQGTFTTATGGYTLSGDDLTVGAGGIVDKGSINGVQSAIDNQINLNVALSAVQSWSINDNDNFHHLTVNGNVNNGGFALTATGNGILDVAGQISGSGSLTANAGATGNFLTLDLDHTNTYTGGTQIVNGFVDLFADGALGPGGTNDAGTVVSPNGQLELHSIAYNTPEKLTLDGILGDDAGTSSFAGPITITGAQSGTGNGLPIPADAQIDDFGSGTFTLSGPTLVNNGHAALLVNGRNLALGGNSVVIIDNTINGPGGLLVVGAAVQLGAANSYQGPTYLFGVAEVDVGVDNAVPSGSAVVMQSGAGNSNLVKLAGHTDTIGSLAGTQSGGGTNTVDLGTGGSLTTGGDNSSTSFAGDITGSGTVTKQGSGTFDLTGTNDYTGTTTVAAGTLLVDGSTAAGNAVTVGDATLGGAGTVAGTITLSPGTELISGGRLSPGAGPDPAKDTGTLHNTAGVTFTQAVIPGSGSVFSVQLGGTSASPTNDQLNSAGTVALNNALLDLSILPGAGPFNAGQSFVIIQAGAPISGTFNNLPEGSIVNAGGQNFSISYANDKVTLTTLPALVVTTANDDNDGGTLANPLGADGTLSLREAIELANLYGGPQTISFDIPGSGVHTIDVGSTGLGSLPIIKVPVTIDGYTQPGASANTLASGDNAVILIALNGNATDGQGNDVTGLQLTGGSSTVRGLAIGNFGTSSAGVGGETGLSITSSGGDIIEGNFLGTDATGKAATANFYGVHVVGSSNNTIGGTSPADRNVISGNGAGGGVFIQVAADKTAASGNVVQGNFIGTDITGKAALANVGSGVEILGASGNTIGGTASGAQNVVSGNGGTGIAIEDDSLGTGLHAQNNLVQGNFIGTDVTGTAAVPNFAGVALVVLGVNGQADNNVVGGTTPAARNVISGNNSLGVEVGGDGNVVEGNFIGTNASGTTLVGNSDTGVLIDGTNNILGGTGAGAGNLISGNATAGAVDTGGVVLQPQYSFDPTTQQKSIVNATGNVVQGNLIGTDVTGKKIIGNGGAGVFLHGVSNNQVGGTSLAAANVIAGSEAVGVAIASDNFGSSPQPIQVFDAKTNVIEGNFIGTDATGTLNLGNGDAGVAIVSVSGTAANNTIGGTAAGAGNTIAFNKKAGVAIGASASESATTGNAVQGNAIYDNGGLGIDLGNDGVTQNTPGGPHSGPNDLQSFPVIQSATISGSSTAITGTFNSAPNQTFTLEFYSDSAADPSGHGQGQTFLGRTTVTTDANGNANGNGTFTATVAAPPAGQTVFSATATDASGNTSEFAADFTPPVQPGQVQFSAATFNADETAPSATITLTRSGGSAGTVSVVVGVNGGSAIAGTDYNFTSQTVSWAAGDTSNKTVTIPLIDDNAAGESDQTVNLTLSNASGGATIGTQNTATLTIAEDSDVVSGPTATYIYGQAGDGTAATFVHNLYRELLGREPDPDGQSFWISLYTQLSTSGTAASAQQQMVAGFLASAEYRNHLVTGMYHDLLHRAPEADGLQFWISEMAAGVDEKQVLAGMLGSDEYYADAGQTASGFVSALYRDVLGRTPDSGGSFWENLFTSSPSFLPPVTDLRDFRVALAAIFLSTPEANHKLLNGNFPGAAGNVGAPGTPAVGAFALADLSGNGWDNLYFQGNLSASNVDALFASLQGGASYDDTVAGMLDMSQFLEA